ncbi:protogenin isoform X2 [Procambarus clarkii]|uniref:protogenin isoform X2 n=1 Tax=Procambarus clarkii TaxID=6728 RepID=UPI003742F645
MAQLWVLSVAGLVILCSLASAVTAHQFLRESAERLGFGYQVLPPTETVTVIGAKLLLPCQPATTTTAPAPNVTWINKGRLVNEPRRYVLPNGTLVIHQVMIEDRGLYQCVLRRGSLAAISSPLTLSLAETGSWMIRPRNATVGQGSAIRLTCYFSSIPYANLTWLKDSRPLPQHARYYQPTPMVLQITNVTLQDAGIYRCKAVNHLLKKEFVSPGGRLVVESAATSAAGGEGHTWRPTLLAVPSKVEVEVGQRAILECMTDDVYQPQLLWSRIDERAIRTKGVRVEGQGSLVFLQVQDQDAGVYNCSVVSKLYRNPVTQMIELSVLKAPRVEVTVSTRTKTITLSQAVRNGESVVRISCSAEGLPSPEIIWYKDGLPIPVSGRHNFGNSVMEKNFTKEQLVIADIMVRDTGFYQCVVKNRVGVASDGFVLTVDTPSNIPQAPVDILVNETTSKDILVVWSPPPPVGQTATMGYIVHYFDIDSTAQEKQHVTNSTSLKIEKLRAYTNYSIYIRAFVIIEDQDDPVIGVPSEPLIWRTHADLPTQLPNVTLKALSPTVLHVIWKPLTKEEANGAIIHQRVQWQQKHAHYHEMEEVPPDVTDYVIRDLQPNTLYMARVLVATEAGYPEHNERRAWEEIKMPKIDLKQHDKDIDLHLSVFSDKPTEILVEWVMAAALRRDVFIYEVVYNNTPSLRHHKHTEPSATSLLIKKLEPGTCYSVKIEPHYKDGQERGIIPSTDRTVCTLLLPPATPPQPNYSDKIGIKKVKVKVLNSTSILVTWRPMRKKLLPDFFTVEVVNLGQQKSPKASSLSIHADEDHDKSNQGAVETYFGIQSISGRNTREQDVTDDNRKNSRENEEESELPDTQESESAAGGTREWKEEGIVHLVRVTGHRVVLTHLLPLHGYQITVTAATASLSSVPSTPLLAVTKEGVPSAPVNVSWSAVTPKDAILVWSRPSHINGQLLYFLITYSHDQLEWKNHTVDHRFTTTQIQDLVSNTNYTLRIAGVTGGGIGDLTTVFVYIRATLEGEPQISTELVVISVVAVLMAATCVVVVLCIRMVRLRQNSAAAAFQGNGTCRMVYANGVKALGRDHGTELNDYKPMLASLPPATHNHHLDTKGGPGLRDDGIVTSYLLDANAVRINEADVPNENVEPLHDGVGPKNVVDILDCIDDDDDVSSRLLQNVSTAGPVFSSLKDLDPRSLCESTQVDPNSPKDCAGAAPAIVS